MSDFVKRSSDKAWLAENARGAAQQLQTQVPKWCRVTVLLTDMRSGDFHYHSTMSPEDLRAVVVKMAGEEDRRIAVVSAVPRQ